MPSSVFAGWSGGLELAAGDGFEACGVESQ